MSRILPPERICVLYKILYGEVESDLTDYLWDEFFLLKVNPGALKASMRYALNESLVNFETNTLILLEKVCTYVRGSSIVRQMNALTTASIVIFVIGLHSTNSMQIVYKKGYASDIVSKCVDVLISIVLVHEVSHAENVVLCHVFSENQLLFETTIALFSHSPVNTERANDLCLILCALLHICNTDLTFSGALSLIDDDAILHNMASTFSVTLSNTLRQSGPKTRIHIKVEKPDRIARLTAKLNVFKRTFITARDISVDDFAERECTWTLMCIYETMQVNRKFIAALTCDPFSVDDDGKAMYSDDSSKASQILIVSLLQYFSIVMFGKSQLCSTQTQICLLILHCISDDPYYMSVIFDQNITPIIPTYGVIPNTKRIGQDVNGTLQQEPQPIVCTIYTLFLRYITSHTTKNLPVPLYNKVLSLVNRFLDYQRTHSINTINYDWKPAWIGLILSLKRLSRLMGSLCSPEDFREKNDLVYYCYNSSIWILDILNKFLLYGPDLLHVLSDYDQLLYEMARESHVFENLHQSISQITVKESKTCANPSFFFNKLNTIRSFTSKFLNEDKIFVSEVEAKCVITQRCESLRLETVFNYESFKNLDVFKTRTSRQYEKISQCFLFKLV
ncbi:hypothetical protein ACOME3_009799 [Neoechinorhynchus agilis]